MWILDFAFFVFKVLLADVIIGLAFGVAWAVSIELAVRHRRGASPRAPVSPKSDAEHVEDLLDKL